MRSPRFLTLATLVLVTSLSAPAALLADCACGICCSFGTCWLDPTPEECDGGGGGCIASTVCGEKEYYGSGTFVRQADSGRCIYRCNYTRSCTDYVCGEEVDTYTESGNGKVKTIAIYEPGQCPATFDCTTANTAAEPTTE